MALAASLLYAMSMHLRAVVALVVAFAVSPLIASAEVPKHRLPRTFMPDDNRLRITVDPSQEQFQGQIEIRGKLASATNVLWLNAENLEITEALLIRGKQRMRLRVLPQPHNFVGLEAPRELPAGSATVKLTYRGKIDSKETEGLFRQKVGDDWYAFTHFEAIAARRAFPCFDEPDSKVPWELTLETPDGLVAVANSPAVKTEKAGKGMTRTRFAPTPPLPSYLVAFAVGPFELVNGPKSRGGAPIRVIVPRGHGGEVAYVMKSTSEILALLEDYFGTPYPYAKLDLIAIPQTVGFGAMENPGLITFNQRLLTARPEDFSISYQRGAALTIAHELAHQWFGDLVTPMWWDDIWLNESFASWMEDKIVDAWRPDWSHGTYAAVTRDQAAGQDSLASTRKMRQPVVTNDDIDNSFSFVVYQKGSAVLSMFEHWLGEETFRAGVRAYLAKHAGKNATAADFLAALDEAAKKEVSVAVTTFLEQVGVPLVRFGLVCDKGKPPRVTLAQERYVTTGSRAEKNQVWRLPVCVRHPNGRACTLLDGAKGELVLHEERSCPAWILPNAGGAGYYRSALEGDLLPRLLDKGLASVSLGERLAVLDDVRALLLASQVDLTTAGRLVARFAGDESPLIVGSVLGIALGLKSVAPNELLPNYGRFIAKTFGARARQLGWRPGDKENDDQRLLRKSLLLTAAVDGGDAELAAEARRLAADWLDDRGAVDKDMVGDVLATAARTGDRALYDRFLAAARESKDQRDRGRMLRALGAFRDPALVSQNIGHIADKTFDSRESTTLIFGGLGDRRTERAVYEAVKARYDALVAALPAQSRAFLVYTGSSQCSAQLREEIKAFFGTRTPKEIGGELTYEQAMEGLDLCIANRAARRPQVEAFLKAY
jgi:alanyl aminopeptidase